MGSPLLKLTASISPISFWFIYTISNFTLSLIVATILAEALPLLAIIRFTTTSSPLLAPFKSLASIKSSFSPSFRDSKKP